MSEQLSLSFFLISCQAAPTIKLLEVEVGAVRNKEKQVICEADGWPQPLIQWKRENDQIKDGEDYSIKALPKQNQAILIIKSFDDNHEGFYTCEAGNAFGKTNQTVYLFIDGKFLMNMAFLY